MATTKSRTSIWSSQTLIAGAAEVTSSTLDLADGYGAQLNLRLTNGTTAPTLPAQVQIEVSADQSEWFRFGGPMLGSTANGGTSSWSVEMPIGVKYLRLTAGGNTGQNVTADADIIEVTALS